MRTQSRNQTISTMATIDTTKLLATSTPEDRATECKAIMDKLSEADLVKIDATLAALKAVIADKSKQAANGRAGALGFLCALHAKFGHAAESVLVPLLPDALEALADKLKPVSFEADKFAQALISKLSEHGVKSVMPMLLAEYENKWQTNLGRAQLIGMIAKAFPAQTGRCINDIIPVLSTLMWDVKPQVKEEATAAMQTCAATCKNKDIKDTIPEIIQCILEPEKVAETVHKLAGVVFVQDIEGSALAIMCPLLKRGMDEPTTSIKRNVRRGPAQEHAPHPNWHECPKSMPPAQEHAPPPNWHECRSMQRVHVYVGVRHVHVGARRAHGSCRPRCRMRYSSLGSSPPPTRSLLLPSPLL